MQTTSAFKNIDWNTIEYDAFKKQILGNATSKRKAEEIEKIRMLLSTLEKENEFWFKEFNGYVPMDQQISSNTTYNPDVNYNELLYNKTLELWNNMVKEATMIINNHSSKDDDDVVLNEKNKEILKTTIMPIFRMDSKRNNYLYLLPFVLDEKQYGKAANNILNAFQNQQLNNNFTNAPVQSLYDLKKVFNMTFLMALMKDNDALMFQLLNIKWADNVVIDYENIKEAMLYFVNKDNTKAIEKLLADYIVIDSNENYKDAKSFGNILLQQAVQKNNYEMVKLLLEYGADVNYNSGAVLVTAFDTKNKVDNKIRTLLMKCNPAIPKAISSRLTSFKDMYDASKEKNMSAVNTDDQACFNTMGIFENRTPKEIAVKISKKNINDIQCVDARSLLATWAAREIQNQTPYYINPLIQDETFTFCENDVAYVKNLIKKMDRSFFEEYLTAIKNKPTTITNPTQSQSITQKRTVSETGIIDLTLQRQKDISSSSQNQRFAPSANTNLSSVPTSTPIQSQSQISASSQNQRFAPQVTNTNMSKPPNIYNLATITQSQSQYLPAVNDTQEISSSAFNVGADISSREPTRTGKRKI